jgi:xanthine dehydrogenase large subunit
VPNDLRVALFKGDNIEDTVYRSKAVGEPPLMLGISVFLALRDAVAAAAEISTRILPPLQAPATPEAVLKALTALRKQA